MATRNLVTKVVTSALTGDTIYTSPVYHSVQPVLSACIKGNIDYGSGGTSIDAYVQTSIDGAQWCDVANFHFTTQDADLIYNLSSLTPVTSQYTPLDGAIANNTAKDGILGQWWRVKMKSSGTYGGSTTVKVDVSFKTALIG